MGRSAPCPGTEEPGNQARTVLAAAPPLCDTSAWALIPMTPCVGFQVLLFFPEAVRSAVSKGCPGLSSCTLSHLPLQMAKQASEKIVFPLVSDMSLALCPENLCAGEGLAYCHQPREEQSTFWPWFWLFQSSVLHELKGKGDVQDLERERQCMRCCTLIPGPLGLPVTCPWKVKEPAL